MRISSGSNERLGKKGGQAAPPPLVVPPVVIKRTGTLRYAFHAEARHANLAGTTNPVPATLTIGDDSGTTSVKARNFH